jgi:hypothetical protein
MSEDREKQIQDLQEEIAWVEGAVDSVHTLEVRIRLSARLKLHRDVLRDFLA